MPEQATNALLTLEDAAARLSIGVKELRRLLRRHWASALIALSKRVVRVDPRELEAFIEDRRAAAVPTASWNRHRERAAQFVIPGSAKAESRTQRRGRQRGGEAHA